MSAMPQERPAEYDEGTERLVPDAAAPEPVVVRRNIALAVPVSAAASAVAIAYLWRATDTTSVLDWALCGAMALVAAVYLAGLLDARTPLLVADELGVRIRLGSQWRGLPWEGVERVVVEPRRGRLRDGRLVVVPRNSGRALDGLERRARREARKNQKRYGACLAVPLGLVTRVSSAREKEIADQVAALSQGRADVVTLIDPPEVEVTEDQPVEEQAHAGRHSVTTGLGTMVSRMAKGRSHDVDLTSDDTGADDPATPLRQARRGLRADITPAATARTDELDDAPVLPEERRLRREDSVDLVFEPVAGSNVRPIAQLGDPVESLVIDDFAPEPAYDPVIGPQLASARHRVGLSIDELSERTRIRPHVIESIEVDDFAPCGGDVYARGHLRTLARVLGQDAAPLLAAFDSRYANAPISARRVFEAELATGMTGSMRSTAGGPNWTLLVGVALSLVLVWAVVRLFAGQPNEMLEDPPPLPRDRSASVYAPSDQIAPAVRTVPVKLVAINAATHVTVTGDDGKVPFDRMMVYGEQVTIRVAPPATVSAANGGAVSVTVRGRDEGLLGEPDKPAVKVFPATG